MAIGLFACHEVSMQPKVCVFGNFGAVCDLRKKADASALESYIRLQTPLANTSMAPYYARVEVPPVNVQAMDPVGQVAHAQLQEFLHHYVVNFVIEPHRYYTPEMQHSDELRAEIFDGHLLWVFLSTFGGRDGSVFLSQFGARDGSVFRDEREISRFHLRNPPTELLDSLMGLQNHNKEIFDIIVQMPVQEILREDTKREWERRKTEWHEHNRRQETEENKFHTHLRESTDFLMQCQQILDSKP